MKKLKFIITLALALVVLSGCKFDLEGSTTIVTLDSGAEKAAYVFENLEQLTDSLNYIEKNEYNNFHFDGSKSSFEKWLSEEDFTWKDDKSSSMKSTREEVGYDVIAIASKVWHTESSYGDGWERGYYTGGIAVYVWSEEKNVYSEPRVFDYGCSVKK